MATTRRRRGLGGGGVWEVLWTQIFLFWICSDANRLVQVWSVLLASESVLIIDEGVADWHGRAVVAGEEEERGFSLRTIIDARETVSGFGLRSVWAVLACSAGAVLGCGGDG